MPAQQQITVKTRGVNVQPNDLGSTPDGALVKADNVVVSRDDIIETRRGFEKVSASLFARLFAFKGGFVGWKADGTLSQSADGATWADFTQHVPKPSGPVRAALASRDLFLTGADATYRLDALTSEPVKAGLTQPADPQVYWASSSAGVVPSDSQVAYRIVFGRRDAAGRLILSAPSGRQVLVNPGYQVISAVRAANVVTLTFYGSTDIAATGTITLISQDGAFPGGVKTISSSTPGSPATIQYAEAGANATSSLSIRVGGPARAPFLICLVGAPYGSGDATFVQAYRSSATETSDIAPGDELKLAVESVLPGTSGGFVIYDYTPDAFLGAALYTNPSQEGALSANFPPPAAADLALYRNSLFAGNIATPAHLTLQYLGGAQVGDTFTLGGETYTFVAPGPITAGTIQIVTLDTPAETIAAMARAIAGQIVGVQAGIFEAHYEGTDNGLPGQIRITSVDPSAPFTFSPSNPVSWSPSSTITLQPDDTRNVVAWSKSQQPDSFPVKYQAPIGAGDRPILRLVPTRDSLFVLKQSEGVWRISGTNADDFRIDPFDYNTNVVAPDSAAALDNRVYMLSQQGVVEMTDSGVELISRPIEPYLRTLLVGDMRAVTESLAYAIPVESDRKYVLFLPTDPTDTYCTQAWVFDTITRAWTRWTKPALHGLSSPADDRLYLAAPTGVLQERKSHTQMDLADESYALTLTSGGESDRIALADASNVQIGDAIMQGGEWAIVIGSEGGLTVLDHAAPWTAGAALGYRAIATTVEWVPRFPPPGYVHNFIEVAIAFRSAYFAQAALAYATEYAPLFDNVVPLTGADMGWGGTQDHPVLREPVPRNVGRAAILRIRWTHAQAFSHNQIQALAVLFRPGTSPVRRPFGAPAGNFDSALDVPLGAPTGGSI